MADVDITVKSKRPSDSNFKQQRLPSWQPVLTAGTVLPTFFVIGVAFLPVGVALLFFSNKVAEHVINYTDCMRYDTVADKITDQTCADLLQNNTLSTCECRINFELKKGFNSQVYMYYGLSNYYQNHRRYVKSRDDEQLLGDLTASSGDCHPFQDRDGKKVLPCGAIANSLFNDTLRIKKKGGDFINVRNTGIAWPSDKEIKFRNPVGNITELFMPFARPEAWSKNLWELDPANPDNNGLQNEDLIVWMRTAALPSFRKLYRIIDSSTNNQPMGLFEGGYELHVTYRPLKSLSIFNDYPVKQFDGTKTFILSTTSLLGGKNPFLGIAYIVVGSICLILGVILLIIHIKYSKTNSNTVVNQRTPYS